MYGVDNNRGIHGRSVVGDNHGAEGAIPVKLDTKNARQDISSANIQSNPGNHQSGNHYPFMSGGEKELLGQGTDGEGIKDDEYPSVPDPALAGKSDVDFHAVAPFEYPNFPKDSYRANAGSAAVPLT